MPDSEEIIQLIAANASADYTAANNPHRSSFQSASEVQDVKGYVKDVAESSHRWIEAVLKCMIALLSLAFVVSANVVAFSYKFEAPCYNVTCPRPAVKSEASIIRQIKSGSLAESVTTNRCASISECDRLIWPMAPAVLTSFIVYGFSFAFLRKPRCSGSAGVKCTFIAIAIVLTLLTFSIFGHAITVLMSPATSIGLSVSIAINGCLLFAWIVLAVIAGREARRQDAYSNHNPLVVYSMVSKTIMGGLCCAVAIIIAITNFANMYGKGRISTDSTCGLTREFILAGLFLWHAAYVFTATSWQSGCGSDKESVNCCFVVAIYAFEIVPFVLTLIFSWSCSIFIFACGAVNIVLWYTDLTIHRLL